MIFKNIGNISKVNGLQVDLIVFPPYWGYEKDDNGGFKKIEFVMNSFNKFVCNDLKKFIFLNKILVGAPMGTVENPFSADKRHFARGKLEYISVKNYCSIYKN